MVLELGWWGKRKTWMDSKILRSKTIRAEEMGRAWGVWRGTGSGEASAYLTEWWCYPMRKETSEEVGQSGSCL
jgi:hypothetical protein